MDFATEADRAYANAAFIPGSETLGHRLATAAAAFRAGQGNRARLGLEYGSGARQQFDLFLPDAAPRGLLVFVHGGYWLESAREDWSHLAAGAVARGWACAMPSYTLAPAARLTEITAEIRAAVLAASALVAGPLVVAGHSAGGQLAARMGCNDGPPGVVRVVPISPVAELAPLMATQMQASLRLDAAECQSQSPARLALRPGVQAHIWVGAQERPAFLWQARTLSENWACRWTVQPGRHHFDVVEELSDPDSALTAACLDGL
jgi:arylformamidase